LSAATSHPAKPRLATVINAVAKRLIPRGLMGRALLIAVTPLILMQILSAWVFYESHWNQVSKRLALGLAGDIVVLVDAVTELEDAAARDWVLREAAKRFEIGATLDATSSALPRRQSQTHIEGELRRALLAKGLTRPFRVDAEEVRGRVMVFVHLPEGILAITAPRARLFSATTYIFVIWTIGMSLVLLGVATLFMRNQVRPVRRLARAAEAFGKGRDVPDFKPEGAREVRQAALAFIAMRNRIQRQINQRTAMLAGVSHDLRTPLTRMKLQLELMEEDEGVAALKDDISDMEDMLNGYLQFARGEGTEKPELCDLGELLDEAVRRARRKGGDIDLQAEGDLTLPLRPNAVLRCVTNLIENAQRYAGHVAVSARRLASMVEVMIDDDGPGIPPDQREQVFRPFFRVDGSRNPVTGGVGLGLTIARDVARSHGGDIVLDKAPLGGLRVRLWLPV
jgi:two-component system osmolarity sensor histidine kinase EnvZ